MDATKAWLNMRLDERESHAGGLTLAATRLLRAGQPRRAFELADRRCRLDQPPGPADRAIRALAGRLAGWPFWREDLAAGLAADPLDPTVNATLLRLGTAEEKREAAQRILSSPDASPHALEDALSHLFDAGEDAVARLDLVDHRLTGRVVWRGEGEAALEIEGAGRTHRLAIEAGSGFEKVPAGAKSAEIQAVLPFDRVRGYRVLLDGVVLGGGSLSGRSRRGDGASRGQAPAKVPERAPLVVLVPVYDDLESTAACLDAAMAEVSARPGTRLVVVDDASPHPGLVRHLDALAEAGRIDLKRCDVNLGFAGAVRRGLAEAGGCDVLLLNADAILPKGGLDRLAETAYGAADIGTVTPLSNNGEYTSFPSPGLAHPAPSPEEARRIDAACARLALGPVDLPTGTGFCLYLRHDCRAAIGEMPSIYGRGYFEDMEFCLRARESGFRNVCAPSVFAVHHGSRSFGAAKGALVSRNLRVLRRRFPQTKADCAAHVLADPLRSVRVTIEAEFAPSVPMPLLVARDGSALLRTRLDHHDGDALQLLWSGTSVRLIGPNGRMPQSLRFDLDDDVDALGAYLVTAAPEAVELLGADEPPPGLIEALQLIEAPVDLVLGDLPIGGVGSPGSGLAFAAAHFISRLRCFVATEEQSLALLRNAKLPAHVDLVDACLSGDGTGPLDYPVDAPISIGLLCPAPIPAADAFARALSARLHVSDLPVRLVVLGRAVDDLALMARGNVFVTGPLAPEEEGDMVRLLGLRALVLPPASPYLAEGERMAHRFALPYARADRTFGLLPPSSSSLFLDPHDRDAGNALAIADWLAHRLEAAAT